MIKKFPLIFQCNLVNTNDHISKHSNLLNNLSVPFHFLEKTLPNLYPSALIWKNSSLEAMHKCHLVVCLNFFPSLDIPFLESYFFLFLGLVLHLVVNIL